MPARSVKSRGRRFPHLEFLVGHKPSRMNLSLTNVSTLLERLGNPHRAYPSILIAGTNGKGSVATYASSILRETGLRVGTFYSPHIIRLHERIRLDGEEIRSEAFDRLIGEVRRAARGIPFTYFECLTAVAALHFLRARVDVAVFEVGLGGRLDATNLVDAAVTVVTGISFDHREHLGRTKERILGEKLGIVRAGVPLVANLDSARLVARARARCAARGATLHVVPDEVECECVRIEPRMMTLRVETPERDYGLIETRMIGRTQVKNVATAVRTIELFGRTHPPRAAVHAVKRGVRSACLPGRFQIVRDAPRIVVDVSHNEESFGATLDTLRSVSRPGRNILVFAALAHKELGRFPRRALRSAREIIVARLRDPGSARAGRLEALFRDAGRGAGGGGASIRRARSVAEAVRMAQRAARPEDTIVIMGSHHTAAEAAASIR
jgi:dihydrofolate synthase/folylpolyglutamate synthase